MSVGSQALERSALESKDRDSLVQIATAMGGKPASRAKKADIIDQILELAGVTTASGPDEEAAAAEEPAAPAAPAARSRGSRSGGDVRESSEDRGSAVADGGQADTATEPAPADHSGDQHDDAGDQLDGPADANGTQQGNGSAPREDGETGNRRRRRRGRDRNRDAAQPGGAPAATDDQWQGEPVEVAGLLDLRDEGYGFLRLNGYLPSRDDVYVSVKQVRQFGLRKGDHLKGASRPAARNEKNPALLRIDEVNGGDPEVNRERRRFDDLTPVIPHERLRLERSDAADVTARIVDLVAPIGKGQRGLLVTPNSSAAATTSLLKSIGQAIEANHPDVHVLVLLVDERPEEVTDLSRSIEGEVVASTFDRPADEHTMVAELALERAKRLVEDGQDVVVLFDGLTRLAHAHNVSAPATGRLVGGLDAGALFPPKRLFGAARALDEGGSLTILATARVGGSPLDDAVLGELSGTENLELVVDQHLVDRRLHPAIDVVASSTAHEDVLVDDDELEGITALRKALVARRDEAGPLAALELLLDRLGEHATNAALLAAAAKER